MGRAVDKQIHDDGSQTVSEPAGKVEVDSEGNRVWRWAREVLENTSVLLKRLDNKDLALEPTEKNPVLGGPEAAKKKKQPGYRGDRTVAEDEDDPRARHPAGRKAGGRDGGGGFDPYNNR
jgi:hypothetical protein